VYLAAAGQRTRRVELGTAVTPIGYKDPFRLAADLALADVLSRGRLQVGFSTGMPYADPAQRSGLRRRYEPTVSGSLPVAPSL
jgi:alkanesulfonate monooxygenase SsuD/methylene tetrahydromethanopterin reductase-like flavin-dependent oxidoreductase (luciferase family)